MIHGTMQKCPGFLPGEHLAPCLDAGDTREAASTFQEDSSQCRNQGPTPRLTRYPIRCILPNVPRGTGFWEAGEGFPAPG